MAKPRYPKGCVAGPKENPAASSSDNAFYVNFNNGNVNWNDTDNNGFARFVRRVPASEGQGATRVEFRDLVKADKAAKRRKKPSSDMLRFQLDWIDQLFSIRNAVNDGSWRPAPSTCFIAEKPKAREIHAPAYRDRVLHHYVVPILEKAIAPDFIYDSFSNQKGKGTLAAVQRVFKAFRQVHSGQGGGHSLKLDVKNFFNTIYRPRVWRDLLRRMRKAGVPLHVQRAVRALLQQSPKSPGVHHCSTSEQRALVPKHKRLENAGPGRGLPIGNLSSQFVANVCLDPLDQFVKHVLKVKHYFRYVDDIVLVHKSREQLLEWKQQIERFLRDVLKLELKDAGQLQPLTEGCDFLGYIIRPTHLLVRRRVISHAREKLSAWGNAHFNRDAGAVTATPEQYRELISIWSSYVGHFGHASSFRLQMDFYRRFPWLASVARTKRKFDSRLEGQPITIRIHGT